MVAGGSGDLDHLTAQPFDEGPVLALWVDANDVIVGICQSQGGDLPLGGEGFAGAGDTQHKTVAVEQPPAVRQNQVLADDILSVVDAAGVPDLLGLEGHENSQGFRGQGPQGVNAPQAQGQGCDQPLHLLP